MLTRLLVAVALVLGLTGPAGAADVLLPDPAADVDYQLGGQRAVPERVGTVVRDRTAKPTGRYDVCYVNAFQTQPDAKRFWRQHWNLVLKDDGDPVVDGAWGEWLLDLRTPAKRHRLAAIVGDWVARCGARGFDAVELDNLDSFSRSHGLLDRGDALAYARLLVERGHDAGLAVAQKNLAGFDGTTIGFDLVVAEECGRYDECGAYTADFDDAVLAIEYRAKDFRRTCRDIGAQVPVVLRDRDVTPRGVRRFC
ncbi:endo alpha-1,4 polygalactosaminidase [Nocardioides sp. AX2bis]|uniref:endo alpha-1,4 polygalactosaminidase n=1 Tax=Nocardioides sp. AX2bis TaxID=2653157 RepID=UPI0012F1913D|nr:endo alpha-1,4 polygalactosaminidase [Nocardioides sp. AX2bis]VXB21806.1 conserved exported hypothetical protein [Nocardioides sp. AX2bis]